jgi:hypothetical protein
MIVMRVVGSYPRFRVLLVGAFPTMLGTSLAIVFLRDHMLSDLAWASRMNRHANAKCDHKAVVRMAALDDNIIIRVRVKERFPSSSSTSPSLSYLSS